MREKELLRRAFPDETPRGYHETLLNSSIDWEELMPFECINQRISRDVDDITFLVMLNGQAGPMKLGPSYQGYFELLFGEIKPLEPFSVTIKMSFYTSDRKPTFLGWEEYLEETTYHTAWKALTNMRQLGDEMGIKIFEEQLNRIQQYTADNQIPVDCNGRASVAYDRRVGEALMQVLQESNLKEPNFNAYCQAFARSGLLKPLTTLKATLTIDPAKEDMSPLATYTGPRTIYLNDDTIKVNRFDFYASTVDIDIRAYPKQVPEDVMRSAKAANVVIVDEQYANLDCYPGCRWEIDAQGQWYKQIIGLIGSPPKTIPHKLYLLILDDEENRQYDLNCASPEEIRALIEQNPQRVIAFPMDCKADR